MLYVPVLLLLVCTLLFKLLFEQVAYGFQTQAGQEVVGLLAFEQIDQRPCVRMQVLRMAAEQALDDFLLAGHALDQ